MTICTQQRVAILSAVDGETVRLSAAGQVVDEALQSLGERFPGVAVDASVIMPNHVHAIITIADDPSVRAQFIAPNQDDGDVGAQFIAPNPDAPNPIAPDPPPDPMRGQSIAPDPIAPDPARPMRQSGRFQIGRDESRPYG